MKKSKQKRITIELTEREFNIIAKEAHELDITFNERVNQILMEGLEKLKDPEEWKKFEKAFNISRKPASSLNGIAGIAKEGPSQEGNRRVAKVPKRVPKKPRTKVSVLRKKEPRSRN